MTKRYDVEDHLMAFPGIVPTLDHAKAMILLHSWVSCMSCVNGKGPFFLSIVQNVSISLWPILGVLLTAMSDRMLSGRRCVVH
jgi:hypothetical protein